MANETDSKKRRIKEIIFEYSATGLLIFGVYLNAIDAYPSNLFINFISNFMWAILGIFWRKMSLILVSLLVCAVYIYGIVKYYY
jgi:hypothetical protein